MPRIVPDQCSEPWCRQDAVDNTFLCVSHAVEQQPPGRTEPGANLYRITCRSCGRGPNANPALGIVDGGWLKATEKRARLIALSRLLRRCDYGQCGGSMQMEPEDVGHLSSAIDPARPARRGSGAAA